MKGSPALRQARFYKYGTQNHDHVGPPQQALRVVCTAHVDGAQTTRRA